MSKGINLYTKDSPFENATGVIGLLCEFAPDSPSLKRAEVCYKADDLLGSADGALAIAYCLVSKLLQNVPVIDGLPLLSIFEQELLEECSYVTQAFHLDNWISTHGFSSCRFASYSPWLDRLRQVRMVSGSNYQLSADLPVLQASRTGRLLRKLGDACSTPSELFRRVAPLWSRYLSGTRLRKFAQDAPRGGVWFYSTAYTFTKIALEYEPYLPQRLTYLVEDSRTGGKRLRELGRDWHLLHAWSRASDIPSASQARAVGARITSALASVPLSETESNLRSVLLNGDWYHHFLTRRLPFALYNNRVMRRWLQSVAPEMVLVGNAVWERALLQRQGAEGVPRVMLQHGIMHWVYSVSDEPVDVFLLRGPFFQRVINERLRRKTVICNFPAPAGANAQIAAKAPRDILFITAPYSVPPLFHPQDLQDILRSLLRAAHSTRRRLVIRVHPAEKVSFYQDSVSDLQRQSNLRAEVIYSQGPGAEQILLQAQVAVLFFSTMFLDCLRHGIPIISFGWHWFPYKNEFENEQIFNFASDLHHLEELVTLGTEGRLPVRRSGLEEFLAPTPAEEITKFFTTIFDSRGAAARAPHTQV